MIDFGTVQLEKLILHKVGNKQREEALILNDRLVGKNDELELTFLDYFLSPFTKCKEVYQFNGETDLANHAINGFSQGIFDSTEEEAFIRESKSIVNHLYQQSEHPHIKAGEVFVALFKDMVFENNYADAIGVFKAESKDQFLKFLEQDSSIDVEQQSGVNIKKLDKGCLILKTESEGIKVLTVDNNNYDAEYWKKDFLAIEEVRDENFQTKNYLEMCSEFSKEVIAPEEGKTEQITFMNESIKHFTENEVVTTEDFEQQVFKDENVRQQFHSYKEKYEEEKEIDFPEEFEVAPAVVQDQKKKVKKNINLDTHIQIKIDFDDPDSTKRFIEQGFDEEKEMYFYKVYYNREVN